MMDTAADQLKREKEKADAKAIAEKPDIFKELNESYTRPRFIYGCYPSNEADTVDVDMSKRRKCYYNSWNSTKQYLGEEMECDIMSNEGRIPVGFRGITYNQLYAVMENIKRRCVPENWTN